MITSAVLTTPRYSIFGLVAILLWSTTIAFSRTLTEQLGTLTAAFWIYSLAGVFGLAVTALQPGQSVGKMLRLPRLYLWGCGALFVIYIAALYLAVGSASNRTQVIAVGLLNYLWPGLSLVFSIPILKRKASPWLIAGIALALAGVWLASSDGSNSSLQSFISEGSLPPYGLALLAAVSWGLYSNLSRRWGGEDEGGAVPLFLLASGLLLGVLRMASPETTTWSARSLLELSYMALLPGMLAYVLWDVAVRKGNLVLVASLSYLTPLLSTMFSIVVLGVKAGPSLWAGALLVVVGALICKKSITA
jgi:drug/metabolite transporter (DMT)-like permease